eukprot:SAG22_NODE_3594_length_1627_cov_1.142670_2_plen_228_part_01
MEWPASLLPAGAQLSASGRISRSAPASQQQQQQQQQQQRLLLQPKQQTPQHIRALFLACDADGDRRLSIEEYAFFCRHTESGDSSGSSSPGCDELRWAAHCASLGADPDAGLSLSDFSKLFINRSLPRHYQRAASDLAKLQAAGLLTSAGNAGPHRPRARQIHTAGGVRGSRGGRGGDGCGGSSNSRHGRQRGRPELQDQPARVCQGRAGFGRVEVMSLPHAAAARQL